MEEDMEEVSGICCSELPLEITDVGSGVVGEGIQTNLRPLASLSLILLPHTPTRACTRTRMHTHIQTHIYIIYLYRHTHTHTHTHTLHTTHTPHTNGQPSSS